MGITLRNVFKSEGRTKQIKRILGIFTNFPIIVHGRAEAVYNAPPFKVQRATIQALQDFNNHQETYYLSISNQKGTYRGTLGFEVGVAEGIFFDRLNNEMVKRLFKPISPTRRYPLLDFLIIVTYHYLHHGKRIALNFDYHHLRLIFNNRRLEVRLFHSKGTKRLPLDELLKRIFNKIRERMWQSSLGGLTIKYMRVL